MPLTLVGSVGAVSQGAASAAVTPAYGQSPTVNNLLVLYVAAAGSATLPAAPSGWSVAVQWSDGSSLATASIFYKTAVGSDAAPTVAGVTSAVLSAQLREFNSAVSQPDQTWHGNTIATPLAATATSADRAPGDLVVACGSLRLGGAGTRVTSHTFNNGATSTETSNDAVSTTAHYNFSHGVTTGNASADSDSFAFTSGTAFLVAASFATGNSLQSIASMAGVPTNGMTVYAYNAGRFALPATDDPVPDGLPADYGPFTSANDPVNGSPAPPAAVAGDGFWSGTVSDQNAYYFTASGGGDGHTYWLGPVTPVVGTTQQAFSASAAPSRNIAPAVTLGAAMYGASITTSSTITTTVTIPTGGARPQEAWPASGILNFQNAAGDWVFVTYKGISGASFTGCSGGVGNFAGFGSDIYLVYHNGSRRRLVLATFDTFVPAAGSTAYAYGYSSTAGIFSFNCARSGTLFYTGSGPLELYGQVVMVTDPSGYYGFGFDVTGTGSYVHLQTWYETDF